jgi:hypothetical protein
MPWRTGRRNKGCLMKETQAFDTSNTGSRILALFRRSIEFAARPQRCEPGPRQPDFLIETSALVHSPPLHRRSLPNWPAENGCILANGERQLSISR